MKDTGLGYFYQEPGIGTAVLHLGLHTGAAKSRYRDRTWSMDEAIDAVALGREKYKGPAAAGVTTYPTFGSFGGIPEPSMKVEISNCCQPFRQQPVSWAELVRFVRHMAKHLAQRLHQQYVLIILCSPTGVHTTGFYANERLLPEEETKSLRTQLRRWPHV